MLQVTFAEMVRVLEGLGSSVPAAEAHGCLVGALCTSPHYPMERWLAEIIPDEDRRSDDDAQQALRLLYADTLNSLRGEDMDFDVLLPDDDIPLVSRAGGLSQWCQGFLYGFGTGQATKQAGKQAGKQANDQAGDQASNQDSTDADAQDELPVNVTEILNDLTHIGRASVEIEGEGDESEEEAYAEVVEYVRVGVQLIHDELIPAAGQRVAVDDEVPDTADLDDDQDPTTLH
jgi:uncharacterized protein YgfB (UPF0149 family)